MALNDIIGTAGARAFISASLPTTNTRLAYEKLPWVEIGLISDLGSIGKTCNETTFTPAKEGKVVPKLTASDNGETQLVYAYTAGQDVGHALLKARFGKRVSLCFALNNGKCKYFQALVKSEVVNMGTVDNIVTESCTLRLTEDDVIVAQTPYWLIDEESPYWWFMSGHDGFWTDLNPVYGKVFTTADGNALAQNPGDPVGRVEGIAGSLQLTQPSSPLRPVLARVPKGVGVVNLMPNNFTDGAVVGTTTLPSGWQNSNPAGISRQVTGVGMEDDLPYVDIRFFGTNTSGSTALVFINFYSTTFVPASLGQTFSGSVHVKLAAGSLTGTSQWRMTFTEHDDTGASIGGTVTYVPYTPNSLQSLKDQFASGDKLITGPATAYIRHRYEMWCDAGVPVDVTVRIFPGQISMGSGSKPLQLKRSVYDVTQDRVDDDWYIYGNGTQWMTYGVQTFGTASLFADAGQKWAAAIQSITLEDKNQALLAKAGDAGERTYLMSRSNSNPGRSVRAVRNTAHVVGSSSDRLHDGAPHFECDRWDGAIFRVGIDGAVYTDFVGTAAEEAQNITVLCRTQASPATIWSGYATKFFLIDKDLTDEQVARIAA